MNIPCFSVDSVANDLSQASPLPAAHPEKNAAQGRVKTGGTGGKVTHRFQDQRPSSTSRLSLNMRQPLIMVLIRLCRDMMSSRTAT